MEIFCRLRILYQKKKGYNEIINEGEYFTLEIGKIHYFKLSDSKKCVDAGSIEYNATPTKRSNFIDQQQGQSMLNQQQSQSMHIQ